jgi:hypothetical protein
VPVCDSVLSSAQVLFGPDQVTTTRIRAPPRTGVTRTAHAPQTRRSPATGQARHVRPRLLELQASALQSVRASRGALGCGLARLEG